MSSADFTGWPVHVCDPMPLMRSHPMDWVATVIEVSTRGTLRSDTWYMWLAEKPILRSYHLFDYD